MTDELFSRTFLPLQESLYKVAYHLLRSEQAAEDAVQELYLKLWRGRESLGIVNNPKAYCITVLRNLCLDIIRRNARTNAGPVSVEEPPDEFSQEDSLDAILACEREVECSERQSGSFGRPFFAGLAASLAFACIVAFFVVTGVRNRTPQDTFSDPRLAYAEVEKAFARIGNEVNRGAKMAGKSGEVLAKPAEIINNITGSGNAR